MKFIILCFALSLNLYFAADSTNYYQDKKLVLVGFGNFKSKGTEEDTPTFSIFFHKYSNFPRYDLLNMTITIHQDNKNSTKMNITCEDLIQKEVDISYNCYLDEVNKNLSQIDLQIDDFLFFNSDGNANITIKEEEIIITDLAKETKDKIISQTKDLKYEVFNLEDTNIVNNEIVLKGKININESEIKPNLTLRISGNSYKCTLTKEDLKITLKNNNIYEHMNGKIVYSLNEPYVLIFTNNREKDLAFYSYENNSYVELMDFGNFENSTENQDAKTKAVFRGTFYSIQKTLKKYMRFKATINYKKLRFLQESSTDIINATGIRNEDLESVTNGGFVSYNITFPETKNKAILSITSSGSYEFSDNENDFSKSEKLQDQNIKDHDPTNTESVGTDIMIFNNDDKIIYSKYFFEFNFTLENGKQINPNRNVSYLNYIPKGKEERDDVECSVEYIDKLYRMECSPSKNVHTNISTIKIKIPTTSKGLRILEEEKNRTIYGPLNDQRTIMYNYSGTIGRTLENKSKLSAGAIVGIVLGCIAVVLAVFLAIFCFNRAPPDPSKQVNSTTIQNSTSNINS